ncbi:Pvc16 family protein [Kitasatospora sp. NPDC088346]|uniref:Pvc16 family protein n=1 Tax=Kitasatospora sp. NPDC088346 TaxID=3364073 RepID=UPI00381BAFD0
MSNALAVPTVTAALAALLQARVDAAGITPRPLVKPGPLDDDHHAPRIGVHLYRVSRNAALSSDDLPTRASAGGTLRSTPRTALDLHYLFTFRGDTPFQSEWLLALTAAALHAVPELSPELIDHATTTQREVLGNDLAQARERVRLSPEALSIDEISRLWALYQPGSFTVTLALSAGPVIVDSPEIPGTVLPVRQVGLGARPLSGPRLDVAAGPEGPGAPVRAAASMPDLRLFGAALAPLTDETLKVLVDGVPTTATVVDAGQLTIPLAGVRPGAHAVQVLRLTAPVAPALSTTAPALASAPVPFTVVPALTSVGATPDPGPGDYRGTLTAGVLPSVAAPQRVRLLLDRVSPDATVALALDVPLPPAAPRESLDVALTDAPRGTYRVTLEVDGARSMPPLDPQGRFQPQEVTL